MKFYNSLVAIGLTLLFTSCGNNSKGKNDQFSLEIHNKQKTYTPKEVLSVSLTNKNNIVTDSIVYFLNKTRVSIKDNKISLSTQKLGNRTLKAKVYANGKKYEAFQNITILSSIKPKLYTYKILEKIG